MDIATQSKRRIVLTLLVTASPPNPREPSDWQRLRRFLKAMLRSYGIKCVDLREQTVEPNHEPKGIKDE